MPPLAANAAEPVRQNAFSRHKQLWIELAFGAAVLASAIAAWWHQRHLTPFQQVATWCMLLIGLAVLLRRGWIMLSSPVLFYDAIRTGRRSRYIALRCLYATAFLLVLYWTYTSYVHSLARGWPRPVPWVNPGSWVSPGGWRTPVVRQSDAAALAASFFYTFMKVQFLALIFFTPAYAAGAIAEEKERKTMEFLLATDLRSREIVISKLLSRLGSLTLLVLTGLPILSILQLMGGVDPNLVLAGFAVTGLSMVSLASVSILTSVYAKKSRTAIIASYLILLGYLGLASWTSGLPPGSFTGPFADLFNAGNVFALLATLQTKVAKGTNLADMIPVLVRQYALFHVLLAVGCLAWAIVRLRALSLKQSAAAASRDSAQAVVRPPGFSIRPRVGRLPMIWKEIFVEPGLRLTWIGWLIFIGLFQLSLYFFVGANSNFFDELLGQVVRSGSPGRLGTIELSQFLKPWVRIVGTAVASLMLVGVAVRASGCISGERDRETLDGLLTSPLQSNDILFAKWLGSLLGVRWAWFWLALIWAVGLLTENLHPAALMLSFVAWLVYASCLAGVGIWFSISSPTTLRATLSTLAVTFGVSVGHWLIWLALLPFCSPWQARDILGLQACITPPAVLYGLSAGFEVGHSNEWEMHTILAGVGLFLWAMAACVIWSVSRRRFRRMTSRMPYRRPEFHYRQAYRPASRSH